MRQMLNLPENVRDYLRKQDNMSAYVARLIRQDMSGGLDEKIRKIVEEILKDKAASINTSDDSIKDSVKSILDF